MNNKENHNDSINDICILQEHVYSSSHTVNMENNMVKVVLTVPKNDWSSIKHKLLTKYDQVKPCIPHFIQSSINTEKNNPVNLQLCKSICKFGSDSGKRLRKPSIVFTGLDTEWVYDNCHDRNKEFDRLFNLMTR